MVRYHQASQLLSLDLHEEFQADNYLRDELNLLVIGYLELVQEARLYQADGLQAGVRQAGHVLRAVVVELSRGHLIAQYLKEPVLVGNDEPLPCVQVDTLAQEVLELKEDVDQIGEAELGLDEELVASECRFGGGADARVERVHVVDELLQADDLLGDLRFLSYSNISDKQMIWWRG